MFSPSFWKWWGVYCVIFQVVPFLGAPRLLFTPKHLIFASLAIPALAAVAGVGVRHMLTVRIAPEAISIATPLFGGTTIPFGNVSAVRCHRKIGGWQLDLFVHGTKYPRKAIPIYMGLSAFLAALERAGAASSNIGIACSTVLAKQRPPN